VPTGRKKAVTASFISAMRMWLVRLLTQRAEFILIYDEALSNLGLTDFTIKDQ